MIPLFYCAITAQSAWERDMAVHTRVSFATIAHFIANYSIGDLLEAHGVEEGVENSNYSLRTTQGRFILTLYEKRMNPAELPFCLDVMRFLKTRSPIPCPVPYENKQGTLIGSLADRPAAITGFLEGRPCLSITPQRCRDVGEAMARLHESARGFPMRRDNPVGLSTWPPLFHMIQKTSAARDAGLFALIEDEVRYVTRNWPDDLPSGVVHGDLFPDNVFFIGENISGIIDFYFACDAALIYDVSVAINAWCGEIEGAISSEKKSAFLDGYASVRPLEKSERDALPILMRASALRFLLTRLYDFYETPPDALVTKKDPYEYVARLRFLRQKDSRAIGGASSW